MTLLNTDRCAPTGGRSARAAEPQVGRSPAGNGVDSNGDANERLRSNAQLLFCLDRLELREDPREPGPRADSGGAGVGGCVGVHGGSTIFFVGGGPDASSPAVLAASLAVVSVPSGSGLACHDCRNASLSLGDISGPLPPIVISGDRCFKMSIWSAPRAARADKLPSTETTGVEASDAFLASKRFLLGDLNSSRNDHSGGLPWNGQPSQ
mmetsp:Transcript_49604/g.108339  ORF Transcript_49604/g.108339 Transcript_49604/m.108339 type:complete len:209 (+) Transcript_49604:250-876(+)